MSSIDVHVLKVSGRLDAVNATEFKGKAISYVDKDNSALVIDFSDAKFIDSAGLGSLVSILKHTAQKSDVKIALANLSTQVRQIFELTRLYRLFDIYESIEEAKRNIEG